MAEMTIKRFSVFSVAKMQSLLMGVIGLFAGLVYGLIFIFVGTAFSVIGAKNDQPNLGGVPSIILGIVFMIVIPIAYVILGFIIGCIWALIYNAAARIVGGIKFDLESVGTDYVPPPQQWSPR